MASRRALTALVLALTAALSGCGGTVLEDYQTESATVPVESPSLTAEPTPSKLPRPSARPKKQPDLSPSITVPDLTLPPTPTGPILGGDISWPQCPKGMGIPEKPTLGLPMPLPEAEFVIMGLTNGPAFTPNPCLADQVAWVRERGLWAAAYAVNSYPDDETLARYGQQGPYDGSTRLGALKNVGYQQATYNLTTMRQAGLKTPHIWLDVEPVPIFEWSADTQANAAVVVGAARGYTDAGYRIGAYSTQALWETVVGDLRLGIPEWRAAGQTSQAEAMARCGRDRMFQGGRGIIGQWVQDSRDLNITCPGTSGQMSRYFFDYPDS